MTGYPSSVVVRKLKLNNSKRERAPAAGPGMMDETAVDMLVKFIAREWIPLGSFDMSPSCWIV